MSKRSSDDLDNDHTDELPVLLETVVLGDELAPLVAAPHAEDTAEHTVVYHAAEAGSVSGVHARLAERATEVAGLETQLAAFAERDRERERRLAEKDSLITELHRAIAVARQSAQDANAAERRLATQLAVRDARLAELTATTE